VRHLPIFLRFHHSGSLISALLKKAVTFRENTTLREYFDQSGAFRAGLAEETEQLLVDPSSYP
jgi:hypothetical protein